MEKPIKTTAERLNAALEMRNIKPVELHEKTGISKPSISQYMSGLVNPKQDRIYLMAKALDVNETWLMGYDVPMERKEQFISPVLPTPIAKNIIPIDPVMVPLVGRIAAGTPILAEQNIDGTAALTGGVQADFCLRVQGDSMIGANINDGDIVFIRQQPEVEDGEIAAVLIDDSATLKRFYHDGDTVTLIAENPKYLPMVFHNGDCELFKVLGKAVAYQHSLE